MKYVVRAKADAPLSIGVRRNTDKATTMDYIPGTSLFGMLAGLHASLSTSQSDFEEIFFGKESRFGNLYPASVHNELLGDESAPVCPIPRTASSCKRFGGFKLDYDASDSTAKPKHGVYDLLIPWALFALSDNTRIDVLEQKRKCPECQEPLDKFGGYYRCSHHDVREIGSTHLSKGMRTHTGINRSTGAVEQGILYNRETIHADTLFWGQINVSDSIASSFSSFIDEADELGLIRIGNSRSRGLGKIGLQLIPVNNVNPSESDLFAEPDKAGDAETQLVINIKNFDAHLRQAAQKAGIETPHGLYVPITFVSSGLIKDHLLRYCTTLNPGYLQTAFDLPDMKLIYQNSATHHVTNWNSLWRVPKADQIAIAKGSVFLFGLTESYSEELLNKLRRIEQEGIGIRKREGFGCVQVSSPFHREVNGK